MGDTMHVTGPRVLVVDDERKVADAYALRLEGVAEVTIAYSGQEALDIVDEEGIPPDVVLLDRHMPGLSGDDVLDEIRNREVQTRVIMVTAIDPDLGILEMPFDDYLSKPVEREDLRAAVDQQCQVLAYELLGEYFRLESTRAVLASELTSEEAENHDELAEMDARLSRAETRVKGLLPEAEELLSAFTGIERVGY